jgi:hypothetical protein
MHLRTVCCILAALLTFWLGGCADTVPDTGQPLRRFTDLVRGYDRTLTKDEKAAVITELKKDKARQQEQIGQDETATGSNPPQKQP